MRDSMRRHLFICFIIYSSFLFTLSLIHSSGSPVFLDNIRSPSSSHDGNLYSVQNRIPEIKPLSLSEEARKLNLGPIVGNITQNPTRVEYSDAPLITCNVLENTSSVDHVNLFYRVEREAWILIPMTNISLSEYFATIPEQPWPNFIEYYINATDISGFSTIQINGSIYFSYAVLDETPPQVLIDNPKDAMIYPGGGVINFSIRAYDEGSNIQRVELKIFESSIDNPLVELTLTMAPYTYEWNTTTALGRWGYIIQAIAFDNAGNLEGASIVIGIENRFQPLPILPALPYLGLALCTIVVLIVLYYWIIKEKETP